MKFFLLAMTLVMPGAAFAQGTDAHGCKLLSDGNGKKVWQCAPTPATGGETGSDKK